MAPERAFRNAAALSVLLLGLSLAAFSLGGFADFGSRLAMGDYNESTNAEAAMAVIGVLIALFFFVAGVLTLRARPAPGPRPPLSAPDAVGSRLFGAGRALAVVVFLLGTLLLFADSPYGRDSGLAAVLILSGTFGVLATMLVRRPDSNVRATGAVVGLIAGALLLYAQLNLRPVQLRAGTYGPLEVAQLFVPRVLGPIAIMVAALAGLVFAYVRKPGPRYAGHLLLGAAALLFGIGAVLGGLSAFFETPWGQLADAASVEVVLLLSLTAGIVLLTAGAAAAIVAALVSFVRSGSAMAHPPQRVEEAKPEPAAPAAAPAPTTAPPPAPGMGRPQ